MKTKKVTLTNEELDQVKTWLARSNYQVYAILRHRSDSGMTRQISFVLFSEDGPLYLDYYFAGIGGFTLTNDGVKVVGCGMDMGFHVTSNVSYKLFGGENQIKLRWL